MEVTKAQVIIKPWGHETIIADSPAYGCKLLLVKKGHRLSLQRHKLRDETWYILRGNMAIFTSSTPGHRRYLYTGDVITIPRGVWHRIAAEQGDVKLIEVTNGYVEGDIERKEDDYGRED